MYKAALSEPIRKTSASGQTILYVSMTVSSQRRAALSGGGLVAPWSTSDEGAMAWNSSQPPGFRALRFDNNDTVSKRNG